MSQSRRCYILRQRSSDCKAEGGPNIPVNVAIVLSARRILGIELDTSKYALLALDGSDEAHDTLHVAGHIDGVAHVYIFRHGPSRRCGGHCESRPRAVNQILVVVDVCCVVFIIGNAGGQKRALRQGRQ